jgi:alkanesulfonate monooxygenase SsuD/methylene tetrahydromethanopterin reductase-like flavin-dependent oxidoreductase (luciferase family)
VTRLAIGLLLPMHGVAFSDTLAAARAAEAGGLDAVWVPDQLLNAGRPRAGVLECETVLAAVAACSERVEIGPLVLTTPFRHPPLLAKRLATIEAMAPGRLRVGLGAGGMTYAAACAQLGFPHLRPAERVAHVGETVACLRALWSDDPASFHGRFAQAEGVRIHPRPERPVPIVLAARGPRMLDLVARVADGWNCPLPDELEQGLAALARRGRGPDDLSVSCFAIGVLGESEAAARRNLERAGPAAQLFGDVESRHVFGDPQRAAERLAELQARGASQVSLDLRGLPIGESVALLVEEVLPRLGFEPAGADA